MQSKIGAGFAARAVAVAGIAVALVASSAAAERRPPFDVRMVPQSGGVAAEGGFLILTDPNDRYPRPRAPRSLEVEIEPQAPAVPDVSWTATGGG
jgi:hypothetical protein